MGNSLTFEGRVTGTKEITDAFRRVDSQTRKNVRANLLALGKEGAGVARAHAPVGKTGALRASIRTFLIESAEKIAVKVKPVQDRKPYGYFLEFGVVNHGHRNNKTGRGGKRVRKAAREELMAAGKWRIPPRPWFGAAREAVLGKVYAAVNQGVLDAIGDAT